MSREKQIEEMAKDLYENRPYKDLWEEDAEDIAKVLYNAGYRKQEWISVDERLPEESGEYLVFGRTFGNKKPQIWICECISIGSVMGWCNSAKNPIVEAWMPLPEAPKNERRCGMKKQTNFEKIRSMDKVELAEILNDICKEMDCNTCPFRNNKICINNPFAEDFLDAEAEN